MSDTKALAVKLIETSPSKLLSTWLFQMHVVMLVQTSLLLKILLHLTHFFLEDNRMEPI